MPDDSLRWPRTHQRASASRRGLSPDHNLGACRTRAAQGLPLTLTPQNRARRALRHVPNYNDSGLAFNRARLEAGANVGAIHAHQSEAARAPSTRARAAPHRAAPRRTTPRRAAPRRTAAVPAARALYRRPPTSRRRVARARPLRHWPQRRRVGLPAWHLESARHRSEAWAAALRHFRGRHHDRASVGNHARCAAHIPRTSTCRSHRCAVPAPTPMPAPPVPQCRSTLTGGCYMRISTRPRWAARGQTASRGRATGRARPRGLATRWSLPGGPYGRASGARLSRCAAAAYSRAASTRAAAGRRSDRTRPAPATTRRSGMPRTRRCRSAVLCNPCIQRRPAQL